MEVINNTQTKNVLLVYFRKGWATWTLEAKRPGVVEGSPASFQANGRARNVSPPYPLLETGPALH